MQLDDVTSLFTMLSSFGWSASCLLEAIKLVDKVRKALKEAGGAASQYSDAVSFLESLEATFEHLKSSIENHDSQPYCDSIGAQLKRIDGPWKEFKQYLDQYEESLTEGSKRSKLRQVPKKIQWALKDINSKTQKLREQIVQPLQIINCLLSLQLLESIAKQALSQDQCKQLVDAIHLAAIPEALDNQILKLQEADDEHRANHNEQLRLLKDIQTSLMENEDNIHRSLEKHCTCMEQHVDQILQDQVTKKNTLSDLRYETRSITSKIDQIQADLSPYEAKNSTEEQQMSLAAMHTALDERIRALESRATPPVDPNTQDSPTISTSQTIAFAFGALALGLVAAVSRNDANPQHTCLCSSINRLSTAKNLGGHEISNSLPAEKPANKSPKLARNLELYHNSESNVVKPSSTGVSTHAKSKPVAWTSEFMSVNKKDSQGIQESRNDPGSTMYTKLSDAIINSKESESAGTEQYKCPYGEASACHPFATLRDLEKHIVSVHNISATPLSCPKEGCSRKGSYGFKKKDYFGNHLKSIHQDNFPQREPGERLTPPLDTISGHERSYLQSPCMHPDMWTCCSCGGVNLTELCDEICPMCGHPRCGSCDSRL